ncbi:AfsR/SARP family transcriptional regulator [Paractinoplanes rishiriensis]|uniref:SARP family transcriptional regulator n=1 Tax=Paractinoplanes rishiriensis TaxID=1050105 RepID=A0A919K6M9_9ACTN|nr:tetratricopeptide repeat protein [Actinoplanes rishiriensis]GIE97586.1 SARP family transcriptional regulator [Actinoplanes rishiriensis]
MADSLRFELLGPLRAWRGDAEVALGGAKQQTVLAVLLLEAGRPVPVDRIVATVWGDQPPPSVTHLVQTYASRLRQSLDLGRDLVSTEAGYLLRLDPAQLDLTSFDRHLTSATQHRERGDQALAAAEIAAALALWRGEPLGGLTGAAVDAARQRLTERHLTALELRITVDLDAGRHADAIAELTRLVQAFPLQERLWALLMLALYRADRQAEALQTYASARALLIEELGVEPGAGLARMHHRILTGDPSLAPAAGTRNDLPGDVADFTGREPQLRRLLAAPGAAPPTAAVVLAVDGMAGVGKSTLAVHVAHRLAGRYPDGRLFLDLHAHSEGRPPVDPAAALDLLLRALGTPGETIPAGLDERAARWRAAVAGRRLLLVLDNAASAAQVRPLLPGSAGCLTLVTSRRRLADLDCTDVVSLDVLPPDEAAALFNRIILNRSIGADGDVAEVVALCDRLPLAIRIAAARLRARPAWTVGHLARRLRDRRRVLTELAVGDRSVAASLALSYAQLTEPQQRLFRLLGLAPVADFDACLAAAAAGLPVERAERLLEDLLDAHLVQEPAPGRYRLHDLLQQHAHTAAQETDDPAARHAAVGRMLDHYFAVACAAVDTLFPRTRHQRPRPVSEVPPPADARAWLDAERANLVAAVAHAATEGWPAHAVGLAATLRLYLDTGTHLVDSLAVHRHALGAASSVADRGTALHNLAKACWRLGRYDEAYDLLQRALPIHQDAGTLETLGATCYSLGRYDDAIDNYERAAEMHRAAGDPVAEATALNNIGVIHERQGRYRSVLEICGRALDIYRAAGDRLCEAHALNNAGNALWRLGDYDEALDSLSRALVLHRESGDPSWEAHTLTSLGNVLASLGRPGEALDHCDRALAIQRASGERADEAATLSDRGVIRRLVGSHPESLDDLSLALSIAREIGDRGLEIQALNGMGETLAALARPREASERHAAALRLAQEIGDRHEEARAHDGLARTLDDPGDHRERALVIYADLDVPEAQ